MATSSWWRLRHLAGAACAAALLAGTAGVAGAEAVPRTAEASMGSPRAARHEETCVPSSAKYSVPPRENRSEAAVGVSPRSRSGAMKRTVPMISAGAVRRGSPRYSAPARCR
ncbi:hypothetical protein SGRIM128S_00442 [Streptomyces griseomycini]